MISSKNPSAVGLEGTIVQCARCCQATTIWPPVMASGGESRHSPGNRYKYGAGWCMPRSRCWLMRTALTVFPGSDYVIRTAKRA